MSVYCQVFPALVCYTMGVVLACLALLFSAAAGWGSPVVSRSLLFSAFRCGGLVGVLARSSLLCAHRRGGLRLRSSPPPAAAQRFAGVLRVAGVPSPAVRLVAGRGGAARLLGVVPGRRSRAGVAGAAGGAWPPWAGVLVLGCRGAACGVGLWLLWSSASPALVARRRPGAARRLHRAVPACWRRRAGR